MDERERKDRRRVREAAARRGLASFMNDTKWRELRRAVLDELPFPPMFQLQGMLGARVEPHPPEWLHFHGDWAHAMEPFWNIEWIQVRPRYAHGRGALLEPEIEDCSDALRAILERFGVPYVERDGDFWIYGYAASAPC